MSKSIMHRKDGTCYLCKKLYGGDDWHYSRVEEHHVVFGNWGAGRKLSEHFGLKVWLCDGHHEHSDEAVHQNRQMALLLMEDAQRVFEEKYPGKDFREIFGKNYLEESEEKEEQFGFKLLEDDYEFNCVGW